VLGLSIARTSRATCTIPTKGLSRYWATGDIRKVVDGENASRQPRVGLRGILTETGPDGPNIP